MNIFISNFTQTELFWHVLTRNILLIVGTIIKARFGVTFFMNKPKIRLVYYTDTCHINKNKNVYYVYIYFFFRLIVG